MAKRLTTLITWHVWDAAEALDYAVRVRTFDQQNRTGQPPTKEDRDRRRLLAESPKHLAALRKLITDGAPAPEHEFFYAAIDRLDQWIKMYAPAESAPRPRGRPVDPFTAFADALNTIKTKHGVDRGALVRFFTVEILPKLSVETRDHVSRTWGEGDLLRVLKDRVRPPRGRRKRTAPTGKKSPH